MGYDGRAKFLAYKHDLPYDYFRAMWTPYRVAWDALGVEWCYHVPPMPVDLDFACPWVSADAMASRIYELTGVSTN